MTHDLLFVCAANICRSPLMEMTFLDAVDEQADWWVWSRGTHVASPHLMCTLGSTLVSSGASEHVSAQISEVDLDAASLVVTASREERSALARLQPASRGKTFTLREAMMLAEQPLTPTERTGRGASLGEGEAALSVYSHILNSRRGTVTANAPRALRFPGARRQDMRDIPDVHHEDQRHHEAALRELRGQVNKFCTTTEGMLADLG